MHIGWYPNPVALGPSGVDWGDMPAWLSAVGTVVALLFAAIAAKAAQRVYQIEFQRDVLAEQTRRQQEDRQRRAQAVLVSGWPGGQTDDPGPQRWGAFVRNASETPVYQANVTVLHVHDPDRTERFTLPVIPPGSEPLFRPVSLDANTTHTSGDNTGTRSSSPSVGEYRVEITFTDSAGARWKRDQLGGLAEVQPELVIWADERRAAALAAYAAEFLTTHQVRLRFRTDRIERLRADVITAAEGEAPDVLVGPHDWLGELVRNRVVEPFTELSSQRRAAFDPDAVAAMTYGGDLYGLPYALDTVALIRNTALASEAPTTMEELIATGTALCDAGRADRVLLVQTDPYYMYPLLVAGGGWLFGRDGDRWNPREIGVATPESVAAFTRIRDLGERGAGLLRRDVDRDRATELFLAGRTPYLICACRVLNDARRAGLPIAVDPVPPFAGHPPVRPLTSVHGFYLVARGRNKSLARTLVADYLVRSDVSMSLFETQPRPPALRSALEATCDDPTIAGFYDQWRTGDPMPALPQMGQVWSLLGRMQLDLIAGTEVESRARQLEKDIRAALDGDQQTSWSSRILPIPRVLHRSDADSTRERSATR